MSIVNPIFSTVGFMIKDVGSRLILMGRVMTTQRLPYPVNRHQNVRVYRNVMPIVADAAFVAPSAAIVGNVVLGHNASVWYNSTVRNWHTREQTKIGDGSSIMERVAFMGQVRIGNGCIIGAGCTVDCCEIHDGAIVGAGSAICLGAIVEQGAIVGPGSVVEQDQRIPAGELWAGNPCVKVCDVTEEMANDAKDQSVRTAALAKQHARAVEEHYAESAAYDKEWIMKMCTMIEQRQSQLATQPHDPDVPVEARRFLTPRVSARLPKMQARVSYPVNRIAPWMARMPDQPSNT